MAEVAQGTNCPQCGTFNAVGGSKADEQLAGQCGCCGRTLAVPNASYDVNVGAAVAKKQAEIDDLKAQLAALQPAPAAEPVPVAAEPEAPSEAPEENGEASEDVDG